MRTFYAKLKVYYQKTTPIHQVVVPVPAENETEVKQRINNMIINWAGVDDYEIQKLSNKPIPIQKFAISARLKYFTGNTKDVTYRINAENEEEAESLFKEITTKWRDVVSKEIITISKYK